MSKGKYCPDWSGTTEHSAFVFRYLLRTKAFYFGKDGIGTIMSSIFKMVEHFKADIESVKRRDPAARNAFEIILTYSGLHAVAAYRIAHHFYEKKCYTTARVISQLARHFTGIEIHPGAKIGKGLFIDHGMGVVIGETAEIGDNCLLYQGVTLGGTGKDKGKRHPTLGNNVMVGSGAKVLGPFKVGDNAKIAANAVVLEEVPPDCTAVGVPARIARCKGRRSSELDQIHIPDPVAQELCKLAIRMDAIEKRVGVTRDEKQQKVLSEDYIKPCEGCACMKNKEEKK